MQHHVQLFCLSFICSCFQTIFHVEFEVILGNSALVSCHKTKKDDLLLEIKRTNLVTAGDRSFVHVAPCLWNELPYSLRAANSVETIKTLLKTFLFRKHFSINNVYIMFYQICLLVVKYVIRL